MQEGLNLTRLVLVASAASAEYLTNRKDEEGKKLESGGGYELGKHVMDKSMKPISLV